VTFAKKEKVLSYERSNLGWGHFNSTIDMLPAELLLETWKRNSTCLVVSKLGQISTARSISTRNPKKITVKFKNW
jgi:hypothetical protein